MEQSKLQWHNPQPGATAPLFHNAYEHLIVQENRMEKIINNLKLFLQIQIPSQSSGQDRCQPGALKFTAGLSEEPVNINIESTPIQLPDLPHTTI
jgi:hypothetical protein